MNSFFSGANRPPAPANTFHPTSSGSGALPSKSRQTSERPNFSGSVSSPPPRITADRTRQEELADLLHRFKLSRQIRDSAPLSQNVATPTPANTAHPPIGGPSQSGQTSGIPNLRAASGAAGQTPLDRVLTDIFSRLVSGKELSVSAHPSGTVVTDQTANQFNSTFPWTKNLYDLITRSEQENLNINASLLGRTPTANQTTNQEHPVFSNKQGFIGLLASFASWEESRVSGRPSGSNITANQTPDQIKSQLYLLNLVVSHGLKQRELTNCRAKIAAMEQGRFADAPPLPSSNTALLQAPVGPKIPGADSQPPSSSPYAPSSTAHAIEAPPPTPIESEILMCLKRSADIEKFADLMRADFIQKMNSTPSVPPYPPPSAHQDNTYPYFPPPSFPSVEAPSTSRAIQVPNRQSGKLAIPERLKQILKSLKLPENGLSLTEKGYVFTDVWFQMAIKAGMPLRSVTMHRTEEAQAENQIMLQLMGTGELDRHEEECQRPWSCTIPPEEYTSIIQDPLKQMSFGRWLQEPKYLINAAKKRGITFPSKKPVPKNDAPKKRKRPLTLKTPIAAPLVGEKAGPDQPDHSLQLKLRRTEADTWQFVAQKSATEQTDNTPKYPQQTVSPPQVARRSRKSEQPRKISAETEIVAQGSAELGLPKQTDTPKYPQETVPPLENGARSRKQQQPNKRPIKTPS